MGRTAAGWSSNPAAEEFKSLKPNRTLLESLAKRTGGEVVSMETLDAFAKTLPSRKAPITESAAIPLWHTPGDLPLRPGLLRGRMGRAALERIAMRLPALGSSLFNRAGASLVCLRLALAMVWLAALPFAARAEGDQLQPGHRGGGGGRAG